MLPLVLVSCFISDQQKKSPEKTPQEKEKKKSLVENSVTRVFGFLSKIKVFLSTQKYKKKEKKKEKKKHLKVFLSFPQHKRNKTFDVMQVAPLMKLKQGLRIFKRDSLLSGKVLGRTLNYSFYLLFINYFNKK